MSQPAAVQGAAGPADVDGTGAAAGFMTVLEGLLTAAVAVQRRELASSANDEASDARCPMLCVTMQFSAHNMASGPPGV